MAKNTRKSKPRDRSKSAKTSDSQDHIPNLSRWDKTASAPMWMHFGIPVLIVLCTFITFLPALSAGFTNWDDDKVITENPHVRGLTSKHVVWMFSEYKMGHYHPLTWVSYGIDYAISQSRYDNLDPETQNRYVNGFDPKIVHLTNLIYHVLAVVAFYFLARLILRISIHDPPQGVDIFTPLAAGFAALFFGCHPLRAENAVWVTERRDVLSAMFLIPCLYVYLRFVLVQHWNGRKVALYIASIVLLTLSLYSKAWGITLPAVMLVMDVYPLRRVGGKVGWSVKRLANVVIEKVPFFVVALIFAKLAKAAQANQIGTMKTLAEWGVDDRIAQFFYGLFWYSYKTLVPINLAALIPLPAINNPLAMHYVAAALAVIVAAVALVRYRKRVPGLVTMAVCYVGVLSPILGIAQSGPQLVADKYAYLGCIPWAIAFGYGWMWLASRAKTESAKRINIAIPSAIAAFVVGAFATLAWKQSTHWENSYTLWVHSVAVEPECAIARMNLGLLERQRGNVDTAIEHYAVTRRLDPKNASVLSNLALALRQKLPKNPKPSDFDELIKLQQQAIKLQPHMPDLYYAMGNTLVDAGRYDEALATLRKCVQVRRDAGQITHPKYHRALGTLYMRLKQWDNAAMEYETALKLETNLDPKGLGVINALDRLGRICEAQGRRKEAAAFFRRLLEIDPDNGTAIKWLQSRGESTD
ncbi:MAG: hypothetical protein DHS20C16_27440 [Phycisphaerae bacterium]|nr:MAG: hypothetical protein DHS20C16_27440 [Phycisphaerae bacterium]